MRQTTRTILALLAGLLAVVLVLSFLLGLVGFSAVVDVLTSARPTGVVLAFLVSLLWMGAWSTTFSLVLGPLSITAEGWRSHLVYLNMLFANNVAPFSVGGGEPIAAYLVSRGTETNYETAFLAVLGTDVVNFLPAPVLAIVGLVALGIETADLVGRPLPVVAVTLLAVASLVVVLGAVGWRRRRSIEVYGVRLLVVLQRVSVRLVPGIRHQSAEALQMRLGTFVDGLERVAGDRRVLGLGLATSTLGWLCQATVLWLALWSVDAGVSPVVPLFVVTLVTVTDVVPLPGGIGSVDAALVVALLAVTDLAAPTATAAALIFRSATLLFSTLLGAASVAVVQFGRLPVHGDGRRR